MNRNLSTHACRGILILVMTLSLSAVQARVFYVNIFATGLSDGSSWTDAFTDLQTAIELAAPEDTICVSTGNYFPTRQHGPDTLRSLTFYIHKDVRIYGGFSGVAGTEGQWAERNPKLFLTMLSGDVGVPEDVSDNLFHVVYFDHVSDTARLDGFCILWGNCTGAEGFDAYGGGIFNNASGGRSNPVIANCVIRDHISTESGAGFFNYASAGGIARPQLIQCNILSNMAAGGGGMMNYTDEGGVASPTLINCILAGNSGLTAGGGAISSVAHSATCSPELINCLVYGNDSPFSAAISFFGTGTGACQPRIINSTITGNTGGAMRLSNIGTGSFAATIRNSIFWDNQFGSGLSFNNADADVQYSIIQNGFTGEGNLIDHPLFVEPAPVNGAHTLGDLHLQKDSPAIDAGNKTDVPTSVVKDLDMNPRFADPSSPSEGVIDLGPYEFQPEVISSAKTVPAIEWNAFPNPTLGPLHIDIPGNVYNYSISLYDQTGQLRKIEATNRSNSGAQYNLSGLPPGIYSLVLHQHGSLFVKQIVIQ